MNHNFSQRDFKTVENELIYAFESLKSNTPNSFVGIDDCKNRYVAVKITEDDFEIAIFKNIEEVCSKYIYSNVIIIDMPMGLPENTHDIRPETEGRKILSSRASCIFTVPCRQAVYEKTEEIKELVYSDVKLKGIKDDVIDATCLAVTGMIRYKKGFKTIPENPMKDSKGILMQMAYAIF